jgi:peptidyl-prolyl cis-trans isomerase SurA
MTRWCLYVGLILLLVLTGSPSLASAQEAVVIDETLASVNKEIITRSMLHRAENALRRDLREQFPNDPAKQEEVFARLKPRLLVA